MSRKLKRLCIIGAALAIIIVAAIVGIWRFWYKQYSTFTLVIDSRAKPALFYRPKGSIATDLNRISPSHNDAAKETFTGLRTSWLFNASPGYMIDENVWFSIRPTFRGDYKYNELIMPHFNDEPPVIQDSSGHVIHENDVLHPGNWYQITEYGHTYNISILWGRHQ